MSKSTGYETSNHVSKLEKQKRRGNYTWRKGVMTYQNSGEVSTSKLFLAIHFGDHPIVSISEVLTAKYHTREGREQTY